jgi:hypothetical protein
MRIRGRGNGSLGERTRWWRGAIPLFAATLFSSPLFGQLNYTPYAFTTFAGSVGVTGSRDGIGTNALLTYPIAATVDRAGNVYVSENSHIIRKITPAGLVTILAGQVNGVGFNDGTGGAARFFAPNGITADPAGNLYVTDSFQTIRKITPAGVVTTIAGLANIFASGGSADGTNSDARFSNPVGITADQNGALFVADQSNHKIRKITPMGTNWVVTTLAGLAGSPGSSDGTNSDARFNNPRGVAVDGAGVLYVTDTDNHTLRKLTPQGTNWVVSTLAGSAGNHGSVDATNTDALFWRPHGISVDKQGNLFVAEHDSDLIRKVTPVGTNWVVTTVAGVPSTPGSTDGVGSNALFYTPTTVSLDEAGNLYVADLFNSTIRKSVAFWTNTLGGNWSSAANWTGATVPGAGANVAISASGNYTVNLDTNATVGTLTLGGGGGQQTLSLTNSVSYTSLGGTVLGNGNGSTGVIAIAAGSFIATNSVLVGPLGVGRMMITGGNVTLGVVKLGGTNIGASGELNLTGGHLTILSNISANAIVNGGGDMDGSGGTIIIGEDHDASMVVNAGTTTNVGRIFVGYSPGSTGTFAQNGGMVIVTNIVTVGDCVSNSIGLMTVSGGVLYVTNAAHTATLDVRQGSLLLAGGTLVVDRLLVTNNCGGVFNRSGGTLIFRELVQAGSGTTVVTNLIVGEDPTTPAGVLTLGSGSSIYVTNTSHDAVAEVRNGTLLLGPGSMLVVDTLVITNESGHFIKNGGTLVAGKIILAPYFDADIDGQSNTNEIRAGTDPLDPNSSFRAIGATAINGNDVRVEWTAVGGHSYVVQWTPGGLNGQNSFLDLSPVITWGGVGSGATNWVHVGGATNGSGVYRARLGP